MKNIVILTKPVEGIENRSDDTKVMGSIENPKTTSDMNAGVKSLIVDQPSSWNAINVITNTKAVRIYVIKSKMNDVIQNVDTFNPLTNCKSFALETLSLI